MGEWRPLRETPAHGWAPLPRHRVEREPTRWELDRWGLLASWEYNSRELTVAHGLPCSRGGCSDACDAIARRHPMLSAAGWPACPNRLRSSSEWQLAVQMWNAVQGGFAVSWDDVPAYVVDVFSALRRAQG